MGKICFFREFRVVEMRFFKFCVTEICSFAECYPGEIYYVSKLSFREICFSKEIRACKKYGLGDWIFNFFYNFLEIYAWKIIVYAKDLFLLFNIFFYFV